MRVRQVVVAVVVLLLGVFTDLAAQTRWQAVTDCVNGVPVVHLAPGIASELVDELMVHEMVHVQQITALARGRSCEETLRWILRNPEVLVRLEAKAYCTQAYWVEQQGGADARDSLERMMNGFWLYLNREVSYTVIRRAFARECVIHAL